MNLTNLEPTMAHPKYLFSVAGADCLAILLSGCVIELAPFWHPHDWGYH